MLKLFEYNLCCEPFPASENLLDDLELSAFLNRYFVSPMQYITRDPEAIKERHEICKALLSDESLTDAFRQFHDTSLAFMDSSISTENAPWQTVRNHAGIRLFWDTARGLIGAIAACKMPEIFHLLSCRLESLLAKWYPAGFEDAWDNYAGGTQLPNSISFMIRFTQDLELESIAFASVRREQYTKKPGAMYADNLMLLLPVSGLLPTLNRYREHVLLNRLKKSLEHVFSAQADILKKQTVALKQNIAADIRGFVNELNFVIGMVDYAKAVSACTTICFAEILQMGEKTISVKGMIHPVLAERADAVANDIIATHEYILLGGANMGGKTTYLRTAGAMQLLFQMGLPLPAVSAAISLVSGIYSVFAREEATVLNRGLLGRELIEIRDAMSVMDENCLFLANEPITATSPTESLYLCREALCILKAKRIQGIWVTHLYDLFDDAAKLNIVEFGSKFKFMRVGFGTGHKYSILPGIPDSHM